MTCTARFTTAFVRNRLASLSSWRATKNVFTRQDTICERCTSKRDSRCCICPFLISVCLPKTTWNRQSNTRLPTHRQDITLLFTVLQALVGLDSLWRIWQSGVWVSLVLRHSSGCDTISLVLWKPLSNNGWYSMTSGLKGPGSP